MTILTHLHLGPQSSCWLQPTLFSRVANLAGNVLRLPASHPCIMPLWPSLAWAGHTLSKRLANLQSCQSLECPTTSGSGVPVPGTSKLGKSRDGVCFLVLRISHLQCRIHLGPGRLRPV